MTEEYIGSNFDSFLSDEGILEETERTAIKRVLALQLLELMGKQNLSKAEMARRMETSRAALNRLLDPENRSVTLQTMERAAHVLGKHLHLTLA